MMFAEATGWFLVMINIFRGIVAMGAIALLISIVWIFWKLD